MSEEKQRVGARNGRAAWAKSGIRHTNVEWVNERRAGSANASSKCRRWVCVCVLRVAFCEKNIKTFHILHTKPQQTHHTRIYSCNGIHFYLESTPQRLLTRQLLQQSCSILTNSTFTRLLMRVCVCVLGNVSEWVAQSVWQVSTNFFVVGDSTLATDVTPPSLTWPGLAWPHICTLDCLGFPGACMYVHTYNCMWVWSYKSVFIFCRFSF